MNNIPHAEQLQTLLKALDLQLGLTEDRFELVVIGGSGMLALKVGSRATHDVDLLAIQSADGLVRIDGMPESLTAAAARVAADFDLGDDWFNPGPTALMDLGLPEGFEQRLEDLYRGPNLQVSTASRLDQIHFKLYAFADQGAGKHEQDLNALDPTEEELVQAAAWTRTHDPSEGFHSVLIQVLEHLGVQDAAERV